MTPQERKLVEDLFERLATLERNPREPEAEQLIRDGLRKAPNATYALVQTVLLQEEALRQANERIRELEAADAPQEQQSGSFLDTMREAVFGGGQTRTSVPPTVSNRPMGVPPGFRRDADPNQPQAGAAYPQAPERGGGFGGSFLGTAAAAAAGVIGGTLLMNSLKGAFGGDAKAHGLSDASGQQAANPWSDAASGNSDLAREAGIDSIGKPGGDESARSALYGHGHEPMDDGAMLDDDGGFDMDFDADFL